MKKFYFLLLGLFLLSFSSIQAQNVSAKFGKGINFLAADSSFSLKAQFRFQSLYEAKRNLEAGSDWSSSFLIRRSRLKFSGWAVNPNLGYKVELALSNRDLKSSADYEETSGAPKIILDAVLKWKFHENFELWAGQTKLPGNRERVVSSQKLELVDRSLVNKFFNLDRDMGVHLRGKFKAGNAVIKPIVAIAMGEGRNVTTKNIGGYNYTARLEFLPFGDFSKKGDYFEADLKRESKPKLAFGATYNFNDGASRQTQTGVFLQDADGNYFENNIQTITLDAMFKYKGFSILTEFAEKKCILDENINHEEVQEQMIDANGKTYYTGKGFMMQASYVFKNNWSVASRFTTIIPAWDMSFKDTKEYTFGISKYIVGHSLKVQSDISLIDELGKSNKDLRYRLQFEFAF